MKCSNCDRDAMYIYRLTKTTEILYCAKDLPKFLEERRKAGLLNITEALTEAKDTLSEVLEIPKPKKKADKKTED